MELAASRRDFRNTLLENERQKKANVTKALQKMTLQWQNTQDIKR
jgi:hypothetical protein